MEQAEDTIIRVYTLTETAEALNLKDGMLRRYLTAYESVVEPLPRQEGRANAPRLIPEPVLAVLKAARALVLEQPGRVSAEDAIRRAAGVVVERPSTDITHLSAEATSDEFYALVRSQLRERDETMISETVQRVQQPLLELVAEQQDLLEVQSTTIAALHEDVRGLKALVEAQMTQASGSMSQGFWARMFGRGKRA